MHMTEFYLFIAASQIETQGRERLTEAYIHFGSYKFVPPKCTCPVSLYNATFLLRTGVGMPTHVNIEYISFTSFGSAVSYFLRGIFLLIQTLFKDQVTFLLASSLQDTLYSLQWMFINFNKIKFFDHPKISCTI